jgi:hypothetical protein
MEMEIPNVSEEVKREFGYLEREILSFFTPPEWEKILTLLNKVKKTGDVQVEFLSRGKKPPFVFEVTVVAPDWAGLVDTVAGIIHERGYNIQVLLGLVNSSGEYGIVHAQLLLRNEGEIGLVLEDFKSISSLLKVVAKGGRSIEKLLYGGAKKLEIYEGIVRELKKMAEPFELDELLKEDGEVERFVVSRSEAYLVERNPEDLAEQILTNFRFQRKLREKGRGVFVKVRNLLTKRERLTCITVAGFERELTLDDVLDEIREFLPEFQRKYDKQFVTEDGITVIRLEITDEKGEPLKEDDLPLLEQHLREHLMRKKRREAFDLKAGTELFGRVLIPRLVQEVEHTGIPQMYLLPGRVTREYAEFKLAIVIPLEDRPLGEVRHSLIDRLSHVPGLVVTSAKPPSKSKGLEIIILNLRAELGEFSSEEEIYDVIKASLNEVIPSFRDFDEGMRRSDRRKLEQVLEILKERGIEARFVRHYFYEMDDFYRISAPTDELAYEVSFGYNLLKEYLRKGDGIWIDGDCKNQLLLIGVVGPPGKINLEAYLGILKEWDPLLTRLEEYGAALLVFNLKKKKGVPSLRVILQRIRKVVPDEERR